MQMSGGDKTMPRIHYVNFLKEIDFFISMKSKCKTIYILEGKIA